MDLIAKFVNLFSNQVLYDSRNDKPPYLKTAKEIRNSEAIRCFKVDLDQSKPIPTDLYDAISTGKNVLMLGPAGSGKTTLLNSLQPMDSDIGIVRLNATVGSYVLRTRGYDEQFEDWHKLVAHVRASGKPVGLVTDECTMVGPRFLSDLGPFAQVILVGDPCQIGRPLSAAFAEDFMRRANGFTKNGGTVYRIESPPIFKAMNYIGYNDECKAAKLDPKLATGCFEIVTCTQHNLAKAITVILLALRHIENGNTTIFASQDSELLRLIDAIKNSDIILKTALAHRFKSIHFSSLQGKECDVVIFDPFELDLLITQPFFAARYLTMLLGRPHRGMSLLMPQKQAAMDAGAIGMFSTMLFGCLEYCTLSARRQSLRHDRAARPGALGRSKVARNRQDPPTGSWLLTLAA